MRMMAHTDIVNAMDSASPLVVSLENNTGAIGGKHNLIKFPLES
jgi:hypothetical protein